MKRSIWMAFLFFIGVTILTSHAQSEVKIGCFGCEDYFGLDIVNNTFFINSTEEEYDIEIINFLPQVLENDVKVLLSSIESGEADLYLIENEHISHVKEVLEPLELEKIDLRSRTYVFPDLMAPLYISEEQGIIYGFPFVSDRTVIWYRQDVADMFYFTDPPWTLDTFNLMLQEVRTSNSTLNPKAFWFSDYACYSIKSMLKEDLTSQFVEYFTMANATLKYERGEVWIQNKRSLVNVLNNVVGWIRDRKVFSEYLENSDDNTDTKWRYLEIAFFREKYSWYRKFDGYHVQSLMKPGWIDGVSSNKQFSFVVRSGVTPERLEELYNLINLFLTYTYQDDDTGVGKRALPKNNFLKHFSSPIFDDSDVDNEYCSNYLCPETVDYKTERPERIVHKPYLNESFYPTLSLYMQVTMKAILLTGFVDENLNTLEEELGKVFNQTPLEREYWMFYFWLVPIIVITSIVISCFPVVSVGWKCFDAFKGIYVRSRLKKFHIENSETKKAIWEYFKLSLRTVLVFFFIVFLFSSVFTVFILSYVNTDLAVNTLQTEWKSQVLLRINDALTLLFSEDEAEVAKNHAKTKLFEMLKTINVTENSVKFVLDENGLVLASDHPLIPREYLLPQSNHYLAKDFHSWAVAEHGHINNLTFSTPSMIETNSETAKQYKFKTGYMWIWVDGMEFIDESVSWNIIILTPSEDLLHFIHLGNAFAIIATLIIVVVSLIVAIALVVFITQSLNNLAGEMRRVEGMDLDLNTFKKKSWFTEIATIQERFIELIETLREYKKYLPSNLDMFQVEEGDAAEADDALSILSQSLGFGEIKEMDALDMKSVRVDNKVQNLAVRQKLAMKSFMRKEVSVILVKLQNFDEFVVNVIPDDFIEIHTKYIECCNNRIIENMGTFTTFFGSEILASYNTSRNCTYHEKAAITTAIKIVKDIKKLNQKIMDFDYPPFVISIAVASGFAFCGNLGTDTVRSYSVVGPIITKTYCLEKLNYDYSSTVMVNQECFETLENDYMFFPVDILSFDNGKTKETIFELARKKKHQKKKKKQKKGGGHKVDALLEELADDIGLEEESTDDLTPHEIIEKVIDQFLKKNYNEATKFIKPLVMRRQHEVKKDIKRLQRLFELLLRLSLEQKHKGGEEYCIAINPKKLLNTLAKKTGRPKPF